MSADPIVMVPVRIVRDTAAALCVKRERGDKPVWVPRSRVIVSEQMRDRCNLSMPQSLALAKGLVSKPGPGQGRLL